MKVAIYLIFRGTYAEGLIFGGKLVLVIGRVYIRGAYILGAYIQGGLYSGFYGIWSSSTLE